MPSWQACRGLSWCRFRCGVANQEMGCREFTDGEWVWPEGLTHYVRAHSVLLPEEFISSATSTRGAYSDGSQIPSLEFWVSWAKSRRSASIRQRLSDALATARAAEVAFVNGIVDEVLQRESEGAVRCMFAGCSRYALTGRRVCARHMLSNDELRWRTAHL